LMDQWTFLLQDEKEKETFAWKDWAEYGKVKLSKYKINSDASFGIRFEPLKALDAADPVYFSQELKTLD
jgi:hypothetical protein